MKKSNWIVLGVITIISAFLLWLWYYLGLNRVDTPLDLIVSIVWWVVIIVGAFIIFRVEKARRDRIRTMYVADSLVFNSEAGSIFYQNPEQLLAIMDDTMKNLTYDFTKNDLPDLERTPMRYIVRTTKFSEEDWTGEVAIAGQEEEQPFEDRQQLSLILNRLRAQY